LKNTSIFRSLITVTTISLCSAEPVITEFIAANETVAVPGASPTTIEDWVEIYNPGPSSVDLGGWHLTDDAGEADKWTFPSDTVIGTDEYLIVFASGTSGIDPFGFLHADFKLKSNGEFIALTRPDQSVASSFGPDGADYPDQDSDISYGVSPVDGSRVYFSSPSPGSANDPAGIAPVLDTRFSVNRGVYSSPISVEITTETAGATIFITTDSTPPIENGNPTPSASVYTGAVDIDTTTVLRAAATAPGLAPTNIDTQTYIFPEAVASQVKPDDYPLEWGQDSIPDYEVDTEVSQSETDSARFLQGLRDIPTVSVSGDVEQIFGTNGIYSRTQDRTVEAAVSAEYFQPTQTDGHLSIEGFQIDCGFKVQGGASRSPTISKHSLSLRFRGEYGAGKLNFPLFDDISDGNAVTSFDSIHLRAMYNNSWVHWDSGQRQRATMIRDQWMRDSLIAMGYRDGGYGRFVNLYINGLYWGVYNLHERLENDHHAEYEDLDSSRITGYNPGNNTVEERADWADLTSVIETGTWEEISANLDVDRYIDYVLMQSFGDNDDLKDNGNWRATGGGPDDEPWKFYLWDSERTLEDERDTSMTNSGREDGALFFDNLDNFLEFRQRLVDRAYKHVFHDGALTNTLNRERFLRYVEMLDVPIVGESARWGDFRANTFLRDDDWLEALYGRQSVDPRSGVLGDWFPESDTSRTDRIISAWKRKRFSGSGDRWLPTQDPPQFFPTHGGEILGNTQLALTGDFDAVYYTTDGSDPRLEGGGVSDSAVSYTEGPIPLTESGLVKTRWFDGTSWSALNEAIFVLEPLVAPGEVIISEIHYNPPGDNGTAFVELLNKSSESLNLLGCSFTDGIRFTFEEARAILPGERIVLAEDGVAFAELYGFSPDAVYSGALDRGGERLTLQGSGGFIVDTVTYDDSLPWPIRADGAGSSLERSESEVFSASLTLSGTPGAEPELHPGVIFNEILSNTDSPLLDSIELKNTTSSSIDLSGWLLSDSTSKYDKFRIPDGISIPANGYITFDETDFNTSEANLISGYSGTVATAPTTVTVSGAVPLDGSLITITGYDGIGLYNGSYTITRTGANTFTIPIPFLDDSTLKGSWTPGQPFALSSTSGETLSLLTAGGVLFSDSATFGAAFSGESFARIPDGTGPVVPASSRTLGLANTESPRIGPIIITEVHYDGAVPFVELYNVSASTQSLANWTLRGNVDFDFPASASLLPGEVALVSSSVVVPGAPAGTKIFGPWDADDSLLGVSGGEVRLRSPDIAPPGDPSFFPQVVSDEVVYRNSFPWPVVGGESLQRILPDSPGSIPTSWVTAAPDPGVFSVQTFSDFVAENSLSGDIHDDADGDEISDLGEFALGLNPHSFDVNPLTIDPGTNLPSYSVNPGAIGVITILENSTDLDTWYTDQPPEDSGRVFYRLRFLLD